MKNDTLIRVEGMEVLMEKLGLVEAERFIMLIKKEPFDYTSWRRENLFKGKSFDEVYAEAAALRARTRAGEKAKAPSRRAAAAKTVAPRRKVVKRLAHA